jgi:deoxyxylulose-5-phosphate synthase
MGGMVEVVLDSLGGWPYRTSVRRWSTSPRCQWIGRPSERVASQHASAFVIEDHFVKGGIADEVACVIVAMNEKVRFDAGHERLRTGRLPRRPLRPLQLDADGVAARIRAFLRRHD